MKDTNIPSEVHHFEAFKRYAEIIKGSVCDDREQHAIDGHEFLVRV